MKRNARIIASALCGILIAACGQAGPSTTSKQAQSGQGVPPGQGGGSATAPLGATVYDPANNATLNDVLLANTSADSRFHLLARIEFQPGSALEIYEPAPGRIILSETGIVGAPSHYDIIKGETPVNIYKLLSPDTPVPQALLDAQARSDQRSSTSSGDTVNSGANNPAPANPSVTATTSGGEHVGTATSADIIGCGSPPANNGACDPSWFKANSCSDSQVDIAISSGSWPWCIYNNWGGRTTTSGTEFDQSYGASCASIGAHIFTLTAQDGGGGQWTVSQGTWRWAIPAVSCGYPIGDVCHDQSIEYDITGSGEEYSHCGVFGDHD